MSCNTIFGSVLRCAGIKTDNGIVPGLSDVELGITSTATTWYKKGDVNVIPSSVVIPAALTGVSNCTLSGNVVLNSNFDCNFPLTGSANNYYSLPLGSDITASVNTATGASNNCSISNNGTASATLLCQAIPTTGASVGIQSILLQVGTNTSVNKGNVTIGQAIGAPCSTADLCALLESSLTFNPSQANAKRYGASGGTNSGDLTLTVLDTKLSQPGFITTCSVKYKFRNDTAYRILTTNIAYNSSAGCVSTLLKADQLLFNVDFEITAVTTNSSTSTVKNYIMYANYDFKAGSIGVTSIGGSGL